MTFEFVIATSKRTGKAERLTAEQGKRLKFGPHGSLFNFQEVATPPELEPEEEKPVPSKDKKGKNRISSL